MSRQVQQVLLGIIDSFRESLYYVYMNRIAYQIEFMFTVVAAGPRRLELIGTYLSSVLRNRPSYVMNDYDYLLLFSVVRYDQLFERCRTLSTSPMLHLHI